MLVLEDDASMRELLAGVLEDEGYEVVAVSKGEDAVAEAARQTLDLVVLDVRMEGLDGLEALARMREHLQGASALVITGYASEEDSVRALRLRVADYLRKPFEMKALLERVEGLVAETRQRRLREGREERLRRLPLSALTTLAQAALPPGAAETLERAARLAGRLAEATGLRSPEVEEAEVAAALASADAAPAPSPLVDLAVHASDHDAETLQELWPGRFDPILLNALASARAQVPVPERALLGVARALLHAGDSDSAARGFRRLAETGSPREVVEAWLGLAELAHRAHEPIEHHVQHARDAARHLGPAAAARAALEGGLLLLRSKHPDAPGLLQEAHQALERLELEPAASQAALARAAAEDTDPPARALATLTSPEHEPQRVDSAPWLLPFLLRHAGRPDVARALPRLARDARSELARIVESGEPELRRQAAAHLAGLPHDLLQRLAGDPDPQVRRRADAALRGASAPAPPVLRILSLGPLEVFVGEERIPDKAWRSGRAKHLFAYLVVNRRPLPEDRVLEEFWPDEGEKGRQGLYWATSAIRRCLRAWCDEAVQRVRGQLRLPDLPRWHDLEELERAAAVPTGPGRLAAARRVVDLYRGPFLDGCYMDWALNVRTRVEGQVRRALSELHAHYLQRGMPGEALESARRLLEVDPLSQEGWLMVMQAQMALGRPEEAVRGFESCRRMLQKELEMEPSLELLQVYHRARLSLP